MSARSTPADATLALHAARDLYTQAGGGAVDLGRAVRRHHRLGPVAEKGMMFEPTASKIYRHPTFYDVPDDVGHM